MHPQLRLIVERLKAQLRRPNPVGAPVQTSADVDSFTVRKELVEAIVNDGIKYQVTPNGLAQACDELVVDYHLATEELAQWL